jgi:hypothetical protein
MVGLARLELATSRLSSARSNQLSYKPFYQAFAVMPMSPFWFYDFIYESTFKGISRRQKSNCRHNAIRCRTASLERR